MTTDWQRIVLIGVVLGVTAACVVWWLERFEVAKMHAEFQGLLRKHARFDELFPEGDAGG